MTVERGLRLYHGERATIFPDLRTHARMLNELVMRKQPFDEIIPIVNDSGSILAPALKSEVYTPGWAESQEGRVEKARMLILSNFGGELSALISARGQKPRHPKLSEIPSGHHSYNLVTRLPEGLLTAAKREMREELGIVKELEVAATFRDHFQGDHEQFYLQYAATTFVMLWPKEGLDMRPDGEEVVSARFVPVSHLRTMDSSLLVPGAQEFFIDHSQELYELALSRGL